MSLKKLREQLCMQIMELQEAAAPTRGISLIYIWYLLEAAGQDATGSLAGCISQLTTSLSLP